jgi:GNAT superfamily N-acetyltransferase
VIRLFEPSDAAGVAALFRLLVPNWVISERGVRHWILTHPERAHHRAWVAIEGGDVVGTAEAANVWETSDEGVKSVWVGVRPDMRKRGIGSALYDLAATHVAEGAREITSFAVEDAAGERFLVERGFRKTRAEQAWALDPRELDLSELAALETAKAADGYRLVPLRDVFSRRRELYDLFLAAHADVPADHPEDNIGFEEWEQMLYDYPDLDQDVSTVVLAGDRPVSFAWLAVDPDGGRASHMMTGTLREFRRRGLARLAKLGTVRSAADHGLTTLLTENDAANTGMLALNENLGYKPTVTIQNFAKDVA